MRISTSTIYDTNVSSLNLQQSNQLQTQLHISSGLRVMTPADDPVAAAQVIGANQSIGVNAQHLTNNIAAQSALGLAEGNLQGATHLLHDIRNLAVSAGDGTLNNSDRLSLASALQSRLQDLLAVANSTDSAGKYLFSGTTGATQPFVESLAGVQYQGNDAQQTMQVSASRTLATSYSGADIFMRVKNGNGFFATSAAATNTGTGVITQGGLANPPPAPAMMGNSYQLTFSVLNGVTTYTVTGTDITGAALPATSLPAPNAPFTPGQVMSFNGVQFSIQGAPANGDVFNLKPSQNASIFQTIGNLITTLTKGVQPGNAASSTAYAQNLAIGLNDLDQGLNKVLTVRASMGASLNELGLLQNAGNALGVQYKQNLSQLQDLDMNKAISDLNRQQISLQAAMQSFKIVSGLSLFNYL